jgi:Transposase DDE domain
MVVADGRGLLIGLHVDSAQPHDSTRAEATSAAVQVPRRRGRPRPRPTELIADRAFDSQVFRRYVRRRGIKPTLPTFARRPRRRPTRGRPIRTGPNYRHRWQRARCCGWMDTNRRLVVRYERSLEHDKAFCLMAIILWCVNLILK